MSKKTRKKSKTPSSVKGLRAGPKKSTGKANRPARAAKSTKTKAKTSVKTAKKTPAKKAAVKTAAVRTRAAKAPAAKTPAKAPTKTARRKTPVEQPRDVRAAPSAWEAVVESVAAVAETAAARLQDLAASTRHSQASPSAAETPPAEMPAPASPPPQETTATEGGQAPHFDLPRDGGARVSLADYAGQKLVIFFYPRADTPGCTREAIDFTRLRDEFAAIGTAVLGVSADPLKAQESFRNKHQLSIPLISDEPHQMLQAYGAWGEKSMYGRTFQGVLRTTVLIGADGRIARIWRGVKVDGHADAVLAAAREL